MLYLVRMDVALPAGMGTAEADEIKKREKAYAQALQKDGRWVELWRVVGGYANYSVFDVGSNDELNELLSGLPLFAYMRIHVTPLASHPSRLSPAERSEL